MSLRDEPCGKCGGKRRDPVLAGVGDPAHEGAPMMATCATDEKGNVVESSVTEQTICTKCGAWDSRTTEGDGTVRQPEPDFWACQEDAEQLDCSDEDEAIAEYLVNLLTPKMTAAEVLAAVSGPVEVYGYTRDAGPSEREKDSWVSALIEQLFEWIDDEYGDPDGGTISENEPACVVIAREMVDKALEDYVVWRCSKVCTKTVTIDEAWIKANAPEWLDD